MMVGFQNPGSVSALHDRRFEDFVEFRREDVEGSVPGRFERQVERYSTHNAVEAGGVELTYQALNVAANRVAKLLLGEPGRRAEQVAVLGGRDASMIVGALGILKAGKVWVPLDASYPAARNSYMLEHSQATLVLTDQRYAGLARQLAADTCPVATLPPLAPGMSEGNPRIAIPPQAVACILYTSGSTGVPKGVVHSHETLLHLVMRYTNALGVCARDRVSLLSSCSHITGVGTLLRGLLNGATVLPLDPRELGPAELAAWLRREAITVWHVGPSLFRDVVRGLEGDEGFPELRLIHLSGEPVAPGDVELFQRHFPRSCRLLNNFGCTEMSSFRQFLIDHDTVLTTASVPVGHAVEDTEVLVLDERGDTVPMGQVGEIVVKSRYLALGYWREPALTSTSFAAITGDDGCRVYRTGDLGQMQADGCLMHLGRKDFQVQIRGYRVETAEVETALLDCGELEACAVVGGEAPSGEMRLIAYLVPSQPAATGTTRLRTLLQTKLPSYMVPAAFVWLDALPRLPNGKLDRQALPPPDWARPVPDRAFVPPRTAVEEVITAVWAEVLGVERVGIHDDFFALGAHSLHLTRALSRIRQALRVDLQVDALVESPTVAGLAQVIERIRTAAGAGDVGCSAVAAPGQPLSTLSLLSQLEEMSEEDAQRALDASSSNRDGSETPTATRARSRSPKVQAPLTSEGNP